MIGMRCDECGTYEPLDFEPMENAPALCSACGCHIKSHYPAKVVLL